MNLIMYTILKARIFTVATKLKTLARTPSKIDFLAYKRVDVASESMDYVGWAVVVLRFETSLRLP